jgi:hypothetical protein
VDSMHFDDTQLIDNAAAVTLPLGMIAAGN